MAEFRSKSGNTTYAMCRSCRQAYSREWMRQRLSVPHAKVWDSLAAMMGRECARCGYHEFSAAFEFVPLLAASGEGKPSLSATVSRFAYHATHDNWEALIDRLAEHVLLCANCGAALGRGQWSIDELDAECIKLRYRAPMPSLQHA